MEIAIGLEKMAIRTTRIRRLFSRILPILAAVLLLLSALYLVSDVQRGSERFSQLYFWVIGLTGLALLLLAVSIIQRIVELVRGVRSGRPGARLSARMVGTFLVLAIPPALIVYLFSMEFLDETIDGWFDVQIESALEDSITLGQQFLEMSTLQVRNQMLRLAEDLEGLDDIQLEDQLWRRVSASGPVELTVLNDAGQIQSMVNIDPSQLAPNRPGDYALQQAVRIGEFAAAEPTTTGGMQIRILTTLPATLAGGGDRYLQSIYPMPANFTALAANIENEYNRYQRVAYLRNSLKQSFILILSLVMLISVLLAMLAAILAARRMVKPIGEMAAATQAVAKGDFSQEISVSSKDELGFLLQSFNLMTSKLQDASEAAERNRRQSLAQKKYLEAVLGRLSAGVLTFDRQQRLITCNDSSAAILGLELSGYVGKNLTEIAQLHPFLEPLMNRLARELDASGESWRHELKLERYESPLVLMCSGSSLPSGPDHEGGHVLVFDDATVLNQAQRDAAWTEVARRLAHEVKNPLTPIRLSAERLRLKFLDKLKPEDAAILDRSTQTIINQVDALKSLVNAFGDYAKEPVLKPAPVSIDQLVQDVVELYKDPHNPVALKLQLDTPQNSVNADSGRLRQLLHNLLKNAVAAVKDVEHPEILIRSSVEQSDSLNWVRLDVIDNGPGLGQTIEDRPFEPYRTTKPGGTGLGLAICRKIVQEHGGRINIENDAGQGVIASVWLPSPATLSLVPDPREKSA